MNDEIDNTTGHGGEIHQTATDDRESLTTNQGTTVADNQNSETAGPRGPTLLEDFILREKITHFDHERIPERVVHARGYGVKGYFQSYEDHSKLTKAAFLRDPKEKTPVFVRFSTVAGSKGSFDTARDVRGFAVKFYTSEGNYDLVGNNIPVFFIQDAIKFPDLIHSVKPEPDRGFPQAQSAHTTFWDFASLMPESMHMLTWVMSDRAIPRSFRMMEGFGVHTFRMINDAGESTFVKFHWRPKLGSLGLVWNEAVKISGADPDFHRRDMWDAIQAGDFPEFEFSVQAFDEKTADGFDFDVLDPTKIIPEELVPLKPLGKMVLDQNVDEFFAETEQVAFCPSHVVPGIDFSNDPLLQGRLFSYLDTQLKRLGGPNFHEIEVNRPKCPWHNLQRGGHMRQRISKGRGHYEPNSLDEEKPREDPKRGFTSYPERVEGDKRRTRPESFADHYTQARLFYISQTEPERRHIENGFSFELGKCDEHVRKRMLGHLELIHPDLGSTVAKALGMEGQADKIEPAVAPKDPEPSPALSMIEKAPKSIEGKKIGVLISEGVDDALLDALKSKAEDGGAKVETVAPKIGGVTSAAGKHIAATHFLSGAPSVVFDYVVVAIAEPAAKDIEKEAGAVAWVHDAFWHLKVIGFTAAAAGLLDKAGVNAESEDGVVALDGDGLEQFLEDAKQYRIWSREPKVMSPG